jgi:hypothetical protein
MAIAAHFLLRVFVIWWVGKSNVTYTFKRIRPNHDVGTDERPQSMAQGKLVYMKAFSTQFTSRKVEWEPDSFWPTWDVTDIDVSFELFMQLCNPRNVQLNAQKLSDVSDNLEYAARTTHSVNISRFTVGMNANYWAGSVTLAFAHWKQLMQQRERLDFPRALVSA